MPHDIVRRLYEAARAEAGGRPLTIQAAEGPLRHVGKGDVVFILTGEIVSQTLLPDRQRAF